MASGKDHDKCILFTTPAAWLISWGLTHNYTVASWLSAGYYFGGLWLSPDLDLKSNPWKRWGYLKFIWKPYQSIPHRHFLSHGIFIGTLGRLIYLGSILCVVKILIESTGHKDFLKIIWTWGLKNSFYLGFAVVGIELSAWNHLVMDGIFFKGIKNLFTGFRDSKWRY